MHQALIYRTQQAASNQGVKWLDLDDDLLTRSVSVELKTRIVVLGTNKH